MNVKNIVGKIARDYVKEVISPQYRAKQDHREGLGLEANPYPKNTEERFDYAFEMHRLQVLELKQLMNGEENA